MTTISKVQNIERSGDNEIETTVIWEVQTLKT